jgi:hypothetical protein
MAIENAVRAALRLVSGGFSETEAGDERPAALPLPGRPEAPRSEKRIAADQKLAWWSSYPLRRAGCAQRRGVSLVTSPAQTRSANAPRNPEGEIASLGDEVPEKEQRPSPAGTGRRRAQKLALGRLQARASRSAKMARFARLSGPSVSMPIHGDLARGGREVIRIPWAMVERNARREDRRPREYRGGEGAPWSCSTRRRGEAVGTGARGRRRPCHSREGKRPRRRGKTHQLDLAAQPGESERQRAGASPRRPTTPCARRPQG